MVSLKDCNYWEFIGAQPVGKRYLEELREKARAGDSENEEIYKKQIYSLAAYIAQKHTHEYIDMDCLFSHIDAEQLELLSHTNLFFYFADKDSHIHAFETEIRTVTDRLYVTTTDGKLIAKELYAIIKKAREEHLPADEADVPAFDDIPESIVIAVYENEKRAEKEAALENRMFSRLKHIIRDRSELSYREKLNLLSWLLKKKHDRELFYCLYGIYDGVIKTPEEAASVNRMPAGCISETFTRIIHTDMSLFTLVPLSHGCKRYTVNHDEQDLIEFLCKNEQNRKEHDMYQEETRRNRPPVRKRNMLRDYFD